MEGFWTEGIFLGGHLDLEGIWSEGIFLEGNWNYAGEWTESQIKSSSQKMMILALVILGFVAIKCQCGDFPSN